MLFASNTKPRLTRQQQLASKPIRVVDGELLESADGTAHLKVKLEQRRLAGFLLRLPKGATKTFELDPLGLFVWQQCDGKNSLQQIARKLAKKYNISERESQVATEKFLETLTKKGLIGFPIAKLK